MKYTLDTPPSATPQKVTVDISLNDDGRIAVSHAVTGTTEIPTTPPVTEPPVIPPAEGLELLYETGYDNDSDIRNASNQLGQGSISTTVKKSGRGSFKSLVNSNRASNISSGWRSEVQYGSEYSRDGDEIVVEYDTLYEKVFNTDGLNVQWHGNASGTSGQLALWISGAKFMVMRSVKKGVNIYQKAPLKAIEANKWYHMKWEVKFSSGRDGYVRLYIDGDLYYEATGQTSDGTGQYLKIGTNRWNVSSESIVYFDNLKIFRKK